MLHGTNNADALNLHLGQYFVTEASESSVPMVQSYAETKRSGEDAGMILVVANNDFGSLKVDRVESCFEFECSDDADMVIGADDDCYGPNGSETVVVLSEAALDYFRSCPRFVIYQDHNKWSVSERTDNSTEVNDDLEYR